MIKYKNFNKYGPITSLNFILLLVLPLSLLIGSGVINFIIIAFDILFIIEIIKQNKIDFLKNNIFYFLITIWIYLIINSVLGINTENSIIRSFGFVRFIILVMGINYYLYKDYKLFEEIILKLWSFLFLIVTLDLLFESIFGFNTFGNQSLATGRLSGFLGEELKIGNYYFGFVLIALSFIIYKFKNNYIFFFLTILFLTVALLIGERSNFLKILIIVPMFTLLFEKKYFLKKIFLLLIAVSILISIIFFIF